VVTHDDIPAKDFFHHRTLRDAHEILTCVHFQILSSLLSPNKIMKVAAALALTATMATAFTPFSLNPTVRGIRHTTSLNAEITAALVKELRESTGAGMMDCKKALTEFSGDIEAAAEDLRKKGLAKADKKASRIAAEGKIAIGKSSDGRSVLVEVNCETDFVAKDDSFANFADQAASLAAGLSGDDVESLMAASVGSETFENVRAALVAKIGENIQVRRIAARGGSGTTTGAYIHMNRIGVLVELEGGTEELCTDVAMHVAAMNPPYATKEDVPAADVEKERAFLSSQVEDSGKPADIVAKMVDGRLNKWFAESCLVSQTYVKTNDKTVGKLLEEAGAKMIGFTRIEVGEGIEKKKDDFAAEVAAMAGQTKKAEPAAETAAPASAPADNDGDVIEEIVLELDLVEN
jgi:elongation factor Ts